MTRKETDAQRRPPSVAGRSFPIVGIGASAGGLEAFEAFFKAMPPDSGMAFVLVAHLDPGHISLLPELLQKHTQMRVRQVEDGTVVQPNAVYVIPPNRSLSLFRRTLQLMELTLPRSANLPIDSFFRSLAEDQGPNAVCIILSGTGSDGTLGLRAVKSELGLVMVQDQDSAGYDGMPRSAVATNLVDFVLPPDEMPAELIRYIGHVRSQGRTQEVTVAPAAAALQKIYALLRSRTKHDFSLYKENTIARRVERRMHVHQLEDVAAYVRYLQESERETGILFKELLIGVTSFFRDPEAFVQLKDALLKQLEGRPKECSFRVWVPGCSTGEEAYSVAILLQECMDELKERFSIQVFATDIDDEAIDAARIGLYPASIAADIEAERLSRFFLHEEDGYRIGQTTRELLVFAPQSVIKDPPFTKLDLISCRNLLIYLNPELQQKLLPMFHYSLNPEGVLFLGTSETVGAATDLYTPMDTKWKLFARRSPATAIQPTVVFPVIPRDQEATDTSVSETVRQAEELSALQLVEAILQQSDTPPCVIVDAASNVLYVHGRTGRFLEPATGRASASVLDMARPGLKGELAAALRQAASSRQEVVSHEVRVEQNGGHLLVDLKVSPILEQTPIHGMLMVVFHEAAAAPGQERKRKKKKKPTGPRSKPPRSADELELELQNTRQNLQSTIEELETSNEELKSTNEELQSTNEELQSTNEELETSKEELQSLNEESATVNTQLHSRVDELTLASDDMKNLLDSTQIATLFLDRDLGVQRFTPKVTQIIPLTAGDIGRPVTDLAINLQDVSLKELALGVLETLIPETREVVAVDQRVFALRILPYRTVNNVINGVVVTLDDITEGKRIEEELRRSEERFRTVLRGSPLMVAHVDCDLRYTWIHSPHEDFDPPSMIGKRDDEIAVNQGTQRLRQLKHEVIESGAGKSAEITFPVSDGDVTYSISAEPLRDSKGEVIGATTVAFDISERKRAMEVLRLAHGDLQQRVEHADLLHESLLGEVVDMLGDGIAVSDEEGRFVVYSRRMFEITGYTHDEASGPDFPSCLYADPATWEKAQAAIAAAFSGEEVIDQPWEITRKDGQQRRVSISARVVEQESKRWLVGTMREGRPA